MEMMMVEDKAVPSVKVLARDRKKISGEAAMESGMGAQRYHVYTLERFMEKDIKEIRKEWGGTNMKVAIGKRWPIVGLAFSVCDALVIQGVRPVTAVEIAKKWARTYARSGRG